MRILYSISENACYDSTEDYSKSGGIPSDAKPITTKNYQFYWCSRAPAGKKCGWNSEANCFCWVDVTPLTLAECKRRKMESIKSEYDALLYGGFSSRGMIYESTLENQNRIMMAKMSAGGIVMDGGKMVTLTGSQADQVFADMHVFANALNVRYVTAQNAVDAGTTDAQINGVTF